MDIQKISNDIATLKRAVKSAATASLKDKLKKKVASLTQVLKDANIPAKKLAMALLGAKRKVANYTTAEFNEVIKRLSYKAEYSFLKGLTKPEIKDDLERYAKNPGWRFKGRSNFKTPTKKDLINDMGKPTSKRKTYYEARSNRSDVTKPVKLATGGGVLDLKAQKFLDTIRVADRSIELKDITVDATPSGNWRVYHKGKSLMRVNGDLLNEETITKYGLEHYQEMAKGGAIGDNVHIMDEKSLMNNKSGVIIGEDGTFWLVKTLSGVGLVKKSKVKVIEDFAKGGGVKYYNKENEYRLGRPSGSIEKEILNKVTFKNAISEQYFVGSFGWKTTQGKYADGYLYKLDDFDQDLTKDLKLKSGEKVFRYVNRTTAIGGMTPFIKINLEKSLLYFPIYSDNDDILFASRGVNPLFINIIEDKMAHGGGVGNENKEMVLNNAQQIEHHAEELENAAKKSKHIPAWVVAKIYNASSNISDATHYLEGVNTMPKEQYERIHEEIEGHKMETGGGLDSFLNKQMHISKVCKNHGCSTKDYLDAKKKYKTGGNSGESNFGKPGTGFDNPAYKDMSKGQYDSRGLMLKPTKDIKTLGSKLLIGQEADGKFFWKLIMQNGQEHSRKSGFLNKQDAVNDYMKNEYATGGLVKKKNKVDEIEETCEIFDSKGERAIDDKSIEKLTRCVTALPQTKSSNINTNGNYTREREGLHKKIIDKFKKDVVCIEKGKPIAVLMGGSPASGKSTFLKKYRPYLLSDSLFKVDADEIRAELPEYKGWNASQTHEETGDIVDTLISDRNVGIPCKFDFVFDGTMSSVKRYKILINNLRKEGYDIFIVFMGNIPKGEIKERALERYKKSGRFVPMFVIDDFYANGEKNLNELKSLVDGYIVVDGSTYDYKIIEQGGKKLPNKRLYEKLGEKIKLANGGGTGGTSDSAEMNAPTLGGTMTSSMATGGATKKEFIAKKVGKVMREFKEGDLHIGTSNKIVKNPKQAIAIALSEGNKGWKNKKNK